MLAPPGFEVVGTSGRRMGDLDVMDPSGKQP